MGKKKKAKKLQQQNDALYRRLFEYERQLNILIEEPDSQKAEEVRLTHEAQKKFAEAVLFGDRAGIMDQITKNE